MGYSFNIFWLVVAPCCAKREAKLTMSNGIDVYSVRATSAVEPDEKPEVEDVITWVDVAKALDWIAFIITTVFNFGTTALFGCILLIGSARDLPTIAPEVITNITDFYHQGYEDYFDGC